MRIPDIINAELTNRCNLECVFCDHPQLKKVMRKGDMTVELFETLLSGLGGQKIYELGLVGLGEPTLDKHLVPHLEVVKRYDGQFTRISLNSNGVALTSEKARIILDSPVNLATFSLNATNRDAYIELMKADKFDLAANNIREFIKIRNKFGRKDVKISVQFMSSRLNAEKEMMELFSDYLDEDVIVYNRYVFHKPVLDTDNNKLLNINQVDMNIRYPCWSIYSRIYVDIDGNIYPCTIGNDSYRADSSLVIGNLKEAGVLEIFNAPPVEHARRNAERNHLPFNECKSCTLWQLLPNHFLFQEGRWLYNGEQGVRRPELDR